MTMSKVADVSAKSGARSWSEIANMLLKEIIRGPIVVHPSFFGFTEGTNRYLPCSNQIPSWLQTVI